MTKDGLEKLVRHLGMVPVERQQTRVGELFIAEGEVTSGGKAWLIKRGAIDFGQYPDGLYAATWHLALSDDRILYGPILHMDRNHDPGTPEAVKRRMRINTALKDAHDFIAKLEKERGTFH